MARWAPPELVSAALAGHGDAKDQLIAAVWPGCFRLAATVIGDPSLAEDAAQEACVIVHRKLRSLRVADAFDTWLYRIVMREAARVRRRADTSYAMTEHRFGRDAAMTVDVWQALAGLSPELRDVTVLYYFDDFKTSEIAKILRIAHATVRTRLARARTRLRGLLSDYGAAALLERREIEQNAY